DHPAGVGKARVDAVGEARDRVGFDAQHLARPADQSLGCHSGRIAHAPEYMTTPLADERTGGPPRSRFRMPGSTKFPTTSFTTVLRCQSSFRWTGSGSDTASASS